MTVESWKTAIRRNKLSKPVQFYENELRGKILNYGSGRGEDTEFLRLKGYDIYSYDKYFDSDADLNIKYDTIICNYVLNVIPTIEERIEVLVHMNNLLIQDGVAFITVRHEREQKSIKSSVKYNDGILTSKNTFQKFYTEKELAEFIKNHFNKVDLVLSCPLIFRVSN